MRVCLVIFVACIGYVVRHAHGQLTPDQQTAVVANINKFRKEASAGMADVAWDSGLATEAKGTADLCKYKSDPTPGQNIRFKPGGTDPAALVEDWYNAKVAYDYDGNKCQYNNPLGCSHYTQLVWADSTKVGCAAKMCAKMDFPDGMTQANCLFLVCNFSPKADITAKKPY